MSILHRPQQSIQRTRLCLILTVRSRLHLTGRAAWTRVSISLLSSTKSIIGVTTTLLSQSRTKAHFPASPKHNVNRLEMHLLVWTRLITTSLSTRRCWTSAITTKLRRISNHSTRPAVSRGHTKACSWTVANVQSPELQTRRMPSIPLLSTCTQATLVPTRSMPDCA